MLVVFSLSFVADTIIIIVYNFVDPLKLAYQNHMRVILLSVDYGKAVKSFR